MNICIACESSPALLWGLVSSLGTVGAKFGLCYISVCLTGRDMESLSSASRCVSILVRIIDARAAASGCLEVSKGSGNDNCVGLSPSWFDLKVTGLFFFFGRGVGEGSTQAVGWGEGVSCRRHGAGE
jgi:hypothetical protein